MLEIFKEKGDVSKASKLITNASVDKYKKGPKTPVEIVSKINPSEIKKSVRSKSATPGCCKPGCCKSRARKSTK